MSEDQHRLPDDEYRELERNAISWARRRRAQLNAARRSDEGRATRRGVISADAELGKYVIGGSTDSFGDTDDDDDDVTQRMSNTASSSSRTMTKSQSSAAVIAALNKSFQSITSSDEYQVDNDTISSQVHRMESSSLLRLFEDTTPPPPDDMALNTSNTKSSSSSSSHPQTTLHSSAAVATSLSDSFADISNSEEYLVEGELHKTQDHSKKKKSQRVHEFEDVLMSSSSEDDDSAWRTRALSWPLTKSQGIAVANASLSEDVSRIIDEMKNAGRHLDQQKDTWKMQEKPRIPSSLLDDGATMSNKHYDNQRRRPSERRSSSREDSSIFNTSSVALPPSVRLMRIRQELRKQAQQKKQEKEPKTSSRPLRKDKKQSQPKEPDSTIEDIALLLADAAKSSRTRNKSQD